jgi:hypothetical protein
MGVKQDAWDAQVAAINAAEPAYVAARLAWIVAVGQYELFKDDFVSGTDKSQAEWDAAWLVLRQATFTKGPRWENGVIVRPAETQDSLYSTFGPIEQALQELEFLGHLGHPDFGDLAFRDDPAISQGTRNRIDRIPFVNDYLIITPNNQVTRRTSKSGPAGIAGQFVDAAHGHWYQGLKESETVVADPASSRGRMQQLDFLVAISDVAAFDVRDDCAAVIGID